MPKEIRHASMDERKDIRRWLKDKKTRSRIAGTFGFSKGGISREFRGNPGKRGYRRRQALPGKDDRKTSVFISRPNRDRSLAIVRRDLAAP
jgi:IS30 family transposase